MAHSDLAQIPSKKKESSWPKKIPSTKFEVSQQMVINVKTGLYGTNGTNEKTIFNGTNEKR